MLSVEFKVQLLAPARGSSFRAHGRVIRAGRTLTVVSGELRALPEAAPEGGDPGAGDLVMMLTGTMMAVRGRPDLAD